MNKASVSSLILKIKNSDEQNSPFCIPIFDNDYTQIGLLSPITKTLSSNPDIIQKLTKWRGKFMKYFLTQFKADEARTASWLKNTVIPSSNRILFLILDEHKKLIGNIGASNLSEKSAELDNIIRGEKSSHPKLMFFAELSLLNWLYNFLKVETVSLHVFSDNEKAINLYRSAGFKGIKSMVLYKKTLDSEIHYSYDSSGEKANFEYLEMELNRQAFESLHHTYLRLIKK